MQDSDIDDRYMIILARSWGRWNRKRRLAMMLFSGIEFKDFKGMSKCNPITVR